MGWSSKEDGQLDFQGEKSKNLIPGPSSVNKVCSSDPHIAERKFRPVFVATGQL